MLYFPFSQTTPPWSAFRNTAPPVLGADEIGIDNGAPYDLIAVRAYAWGKKGADWARLGHFMIRFDDRFDPLGGLRSTAIAAAPWSDEAMAADAMGIGSYPISIWGTHLDTSGHHALVTVCRGSSCSLFASSEGQPALLLRDAQGRTTGTPRPLPHGAVRAGESWFFVVPGPTQDTVAVHRADLGVVRRLGIYNRPQAPSMSRYGAQSNAESPRLVRRAIGQGIGLLFTATPNPGERNGAMVVLPIDAETGALEWKDVAAAKVVESFRMKSAAICGELPQRCEWKYVAAANVVGVFSVSYGEGGV